MILALLMVLVIHVFFLYGFSHKLVLLSADKLPFLRRLWQLLPELINSGKWIILMFIILICSGKVI